jgi:hypothetical protein
MIIRKNASGIKLVLTIFVEVGSISESEQIKPLKLL